MPALLSHTHCQAPQANAKTKACQRVCLSNLTLNPTDNHTDKKNNEGTTMYIQNRRNSSNFKGCSPLQNRN